MARLKTILIASLLILPVLIFLGVGSWAMYQAGHALWVWILWPVCWLIAIVLARVWRTQLLPLKPPDEKPADHWTPRDQSAWQIVHERLAEGEQLPTESFTQFQTYVDIAEELAITVTRVYHPDAKDPVTSLTIPEILAAAELAVEDLADLFQKYVPAGHLMTIQNWRRLSKLPKQYDRIAPYTWALAAIFSPAATAGRYALSKTILSPISQQLQANVLLWFWQKYVEKVGYYLIEMNSGRLRGGAKLFRKHFERLDEAGLPIVPGQQNDSALHPEADDDAAAEPLPDPVNVTIAVVGQAGSGKTSLIQSLLRHADENRDDIQSEKAATRHSILLPNSETRLTLLDSHGYGGTDHEDRLASAEAVFCEADLVLFTMKATSPARDADAKFLEQLKAWFAGKPDLKFPPVLGVLTQIDLLPPVMEWDPPYHWDEPSTPKENAIHEALVYTIEVMEDRISGIVPVCAAIDRDRLYGVDEYLLPAMMTQMKEARSVALVRGLESKLQEGQYQRLFGQFKSVGAKLIEAGLPYLKRRG